MASNRIKTINSGGNIKQDADISGNTAAPSLATDGDALVTNSTEVMGARNAAPKYVEIGLCFSNEAATGSLVIYFYRPEANYSGDPLTAGGRWYYSTTIDLAENPTTDIGALLKVECPKNAARIYLQATVSAGTLDAWIDGSN